MPSSKRVKSGVPVVKAVRKRDGSAVPFDSNRIEQAVSKAMTAAGEGTASDAARITRVVTKDLARAAKKAGSKYVPTVEEIQDLVEKALILNGFVKVSKAYILYRERRAEVRREKGTVPTPVRELVEESRKYFQNQLAEFVYYTSYARWKEELGRRETWIETVDRYMDFMREKVKDRLSADEYREIRQAILEQRICPSMRLLWSAGPAARNSNVCAYNCAFVAPTKPRDFGEIMYISMCGTGLGFSVESEFVEQLPQIKRQTGKKLPTHVVEDSKEGWADAFVKGLETWFAGADIEFDYSKVRPAGARLRTMGGRASGPDPLRELIEFARFKIVSRQGKRLRTIDVHDICCKIGEVVVAGGVRRSAMISLSDLGDEDVRDAKKGQFYLTEPQRSMANNSAVYLTPPTAAELLEEWTALVKSQSGERGIFNAGGFEKQFPARRVKYLKRVFGDELELAPIRVNPCGEIYLQSKQFCNLTSIVVRPGDTLAAMERNMELATLLGTYQSTLTDFGYLSKEWKEHCEAERLLGVSITGYYDNDIVRSDAVLKRLRAVAIATNKKYAKRFGITASHAITCVKPHGNSSQFLNTASGMHPRYAPYYIRRVRVAATDPVFNLMKDQGVPFHPEVGQNPETATTYVLEFPMAAPKGSIVKDDVSALELLTEWKRLKEHFTEHNPSATIYVGDNEWIAVANFIYENWDQVGGLSFLPRNDHVYKLAPYEEITKERYEELAAKLQTVDFSKLVLYETTDETKGSKELACAGGTCEIELTPTEAS